MERFRPLKRTLQKLISAIHSGRIVDVDSEDAEALPQTRIDLSHLRGIELPDRSMDQTLIDCDQMIALNHRIRAKAGRAGASTGCAPPAGTPASLHPWLHSNRPSGAKSVPFPWHAQFSCVGCAAQPHEDSEYRDLWHPAPFFRRPIQQRLHFAALSNVRYHS